MSLSKRLRNIAKTQINALKERLDRAEEEAEADELSRRAEKDATRELDDPTDIRPTRRTPEEIAAGSRRTTVNQPPPLQSSPLPADYGPASSASAPAGPLTVHYRRLGLEDGADLSAVEDAYAKLMDSCKRIKEKVPDGSDEQKSADEIVKRVDESYQTIRDALDPTAGRFDKLEL